MKRKLIVAIRDAEASAEEFIKAWRRAEKRAVPEQPVERLYFEDLATLLRILTPLRLQVLKAVHETEPSSIRILAKQMGRDYKNVHRDVRALERVGLIVRSQGGNFSAPYKKIVAEIALAA